MSAEPINLLVAFRGAGPLLEEPASRPGADPDLDFEVEMRRVREENARRNAYAKLLYSELLRLRPEYQARFRCDKADVDDAIGVFAKRFFLHGPRGAKERPASEDEVTRFLRTCIRRNLISIVDPPPPPLVRPPTPAPSFDLSSELSEARKQLHSRIVPSYADSLGQAVKRRFLESFSELRAVQAGTTTFEEILEELCDIERWKPLPKGKLQEGPVEFRKRVGARLYTRYSRLLKDVETDILRRRDKGEIDPERAAALIVVLYELRLRENLPR
jgi:hypothetical protein